MKFTSVLKSAAIVSLGFSANGLADSRKNIVENAVAAGQFKILVGLVQKAGLVDALTAPGPLTVFAPTDAAFEKIPLVLSYFQNAVSKEELQQLLLQHVSAGSFSVRDIALRKKVKSLNDGKVGCYDPADCFQDGQLVLTAFAPYYRSSETPARVIVEDISASNGTIQAIDTVLFAPQFQKDSAQ